MLYRDLGSTTQCFSEKSSIDSSSSALLQASSSNPPQHTGSTHTADRHLMPRESFIHVFSPSFPRRCPYSISSFKNLSLLHPAPQNEFRCRLARLRRLFNALRGRESSLKREWPPYSQACEVHEMNWVLILIPNINDRV